MVFTHVVIPDQQFTPQVSTETPDSTVESYANNVINFLTSNLKNERVEREHLVSEAEAQIRHLRAQLARREAEMQALLLGNKQKMALPIQAHKSTSAEHASVALVLEGQNRTLEIEIEELKSQVSPVGFLKGFLVYSLRPDTHTNSETTTTFGLGDRESRQTRVPISRTPRYRTFFILQVRIIRSSV